MVVFYVTHLFIFPLCFNTVMFPTEQDALLVLYLFAHGPRSSYQLAKDFLAAGLFREPERSGFKGVVRVVDARLQRLVRDGYLVKDGNVYAITPRVFVDNLRVVGDVLDEDLGFVLVFDVNGHYVFFSLDDLLSDVPEEAVEQLFVGESIKITSAI